MIVVVHQAENVQEQMKARDDALENAQKKLSILVIEEDVLLGVAAGVDAIQRAGELDAKSPGDGARLAQSLARNKI